MSSVGKHKITFESDFELGQEVWVALNNAYKKSPCKLCSGIGKVSVREDGEVDRRWTCPSCSGLKDNYAYHYVPTRAKVTGLYASFFADKLDVCFNLRFFDYQDAENNIVARSYSSSGWKSDSLHSTLQDCQAVCDKKNGELNGKQ